MSSKAQRRGAKPGPGATTASPNSTEEDAPGGTAGDPYIVPAVDRAIRLLALLAEERRALTLAEMTGRLGLPHATAFRLAYTLEAHGLLRRNPTGYEIGPRILTLGFEYLSSLDIVTLARAELGRLRDMTGASTNLAILDGFDILYLCHVPSLRPLGSRIEVGSRMPAHGTSIGRVLLAALPMEDLEARYRNATIEALPDSVHTLPDVAAQAREDRARGWVLKHGVFERGLIAAAAPIMNASGTVIAAINISGPTSMMDGDGGPDEQIKRLLTSARQISSQLGYVS